MPSNEGGVPYSLLGGLFSKDDLSRLFSGRLNRKEAGERKKLVMDYLEIMSTVPRTAALGVLRAKFPETLGCNCSSDSRSTNILSRVFDTKLSQKSNGPTGNPTTSSPLCFISASLNE